MNWEQSGLEGSMIFPKRNLCAQCRLKDGIAVYGEGPPNPRIMLVGQNPGAEEEKQGRPFVGRAGKYLDSVLERAGLDRSKVYITSVVKCRTPGNRRPTRQEISECMPMLVEQIKALRPRVVVLMGNVARQVPRLEGIAYMETYHPAAAMRFPKIRERFEADIEKLAERYD